MVVSKHSLLTVGHTVFKKVAEYYEKSRDNVRSYCSCVLFLRSCLCRVWNERRIPLSKPGHFNCTHRKCSSLMLFRVAAGHTPEAALAAVRADTKRAKRKEGTGN